MGHRVPRWEGLPPPCKCPQVSRALEWVARIRKTQAENPEAKPL